ncbi:MAG: serine hydrolase [Flavobacteriales bacterium]|nr:serine hydrolase [Flavobacteriales bacterium]
MIGKMLLRGWICMLICGCWLSSHAQEPPVYLKHTKQAWVDSVFKSMTPDERLAQLFMVAAYSNKDTAHANQLTKLIREQKIGGLIFFQGGPVRQATMCNYLQSKSKIPMMIAMDAEWGIGMRLDSTIDYPRQMALGAIANEKLLYDFGAETARQMKRMGMHVNFAPVVDVNSNAENPVIGTRSFGENKLAVAKKGIAVMKGMQDNGILACAKHFPGHGDTDSDSHLTLPIIKHNYSRIDSLELYPFKQMIKEGIGSMMVAHLYIPELDTTKNQASTLSPKIVNGLLKDSLGFKGLIFTDALNMKGVSKFYKPGEVELKAFLAGNDVMEFAEDVPKAMELIRAAVDSGIISQDEIDRRCLKVLNAKAWFGLDKYKPIELENLIADLNNSEARALHNELASGALTLLVNKNMVPIKNLDTERIASLVIGGDSANVFQSTLSRYAAMDHFVIGKADTSEEQWAVLNQLKTYDKVIVSIHRLHNNRAKNYGVTQDMLNALGELAFNTKLIVNVFGNPYSLGFLTGIEHANALLFSNEQSDVAESMAAQALFGGIAISGRMPVTANALFAYGKGLTTEKVRLAYGEPAQVGMDENVLAKIDSITLDAIMQKATPGAQLLVAKNGVVVYEKSFGHHTYESEQKVEWDDIYDLASITKIAASLASFMQLVDKGDIDVDDKVSEHLLELKKTNKKNITFRDMLAHYAQLEAWIPFYTKTLKNGKPDSLYYRTEKSAAFPHQVAQNLYMRKDYPDTIYRLITKSKLLDKKEYKYSDLGYYYMKKLIKLESGKPLDEYAMTNFYKPLGLTTMGFLPRQRIKLNKIVPTENDMKFRKQLIQGDVHDQGAAMLGGVGGHAGLFSNANDLAVMMQLFLDEGEYGGQRYISAKTVNEFTKCQYCKNGNRRGIGFDKPEPSGKGGSTCECVSMLSFGHTGFTGTMAWADPEKDIVYIFLSNRVYPDAENSKLLKMDVRTNIQQVIYDSLID